MSQETTQPKRNVLIEVHKDFVTENKPAGRLEEDGTEATFNAVRVGQDMILPCGTDISGHTFYPLFVNHPRQETIDKQPTPEAREAMAAKRFLPYLPDQTIRLVKDLGEKVGDEWVPQLCEKTGEPLQSVIDGVTPFAFKQAQRESKERWIAQNTPAVTATIAPKGAATHADDVAKIANEPAVQAMGDAR